MDQTYPMNAKHMTILLRPQKQSSVQCQESVSMTSFKAFARMIWKEGVLIIFHNQHSDVPGTGTTQGDFNYLKAMTFSSTPGKAEV